MISLLLGISSLMSSIGDLEPIKRILPILLQLKLKTPVLPRISSMVSATVKVHLGYISSFSSMVKNS